MRPDQTPAFEPEPRGGRLLGCWSLDLTAMAVQGTEQFARIYGLPSASGPISFDELMTAADPHDGDAFLAAVRRACADYQPFAVTTRFRWPHGRTRHVRTHCTVVVEDGRAAQIIGTSEDISAAALAEEKLRTNELRLRTLLESAPDAMIGVSPTGTIVTVNAQAGHLFGYAASTMVGMQVDDLLPAELRATHRRLREAYLRAPTARAMGAGSELVGIRANGSSFPVDVSLSTTVIDGVPATVAAVRDATPRRAAEAAALELRTAEARTRQALQINDEVIQGLTLASYALQGDDPISAAAAIGNTLDAARRLITNLIGDRPLFAVPHPVSDQSRAPSPAEPIATPTPTPTPSIRTVIVDDTDAVREALGRYLKQLPGLELVGEASDGAAGVSLIATQQPDLVLLDLSMPVMTGIEALPTIRRDSPRSKVIVLSGYGADQAAAEALELGACAFVEKGGSIKALADVVAALFPTPPDSGSSPQVAC